MSKPLSKDLCFDIETAPAIGLFFGKPYDVNIAKIIQREYVFGFSYKWRHEKRVRSCYIWDYPAYKKPLKPHKATLAGLLEALDERITACSKEVLKEWSRLVADANIIMGHNSDSFDYKHMFGRLAQYGLPPVPRPQMIDTKKAAKQIGNYQSNKLDDLGELFGTGRKLPHSDYPNAIDLWWDCINDVKKAKKHMVAYNEIDVIRTEALYLRLMPYMNNHPNRANITERPDVCPKCESDGPFQSSGWRLTKTAKYRRFQCMNCGTYTSSRTKTEGKGPTYV
jgi:DNA polymerase elongation subunit (family B)